MMESSPSLPSKHTEELWRSKLGTNYRKTFMEQNERHLLTELQAIRNSIPENRICADCGARGGTIWASVNLGVFLCMTCGSHHRSLGTHISLPKGCSGTYWWGPDEIERMKSMGNKRAAILYGPCTPSNGISKTNTIQWKQYLMDKYVHKKYVTKSPQLPIDAPLSPTTTTMAAAMNSKSSSSPLPLPPSPVFTGKYAAPSFSPKVKKFSKQGMPDIDLIHFESTSPSISTPKGVVKQPQQNTATTTAPTGPDFFAQFGF